VTGGRQSNYVYGAAKGGFSIYLQGLRNRLFPSGVTVVDVKPGFVDTRDDLWTSRDYSSSPARLMSASALFAPWWRGGTSSIRSLVLALHHVDHSPYVPEKIFKRLKL
jgi:NAD(P)-dependent dehydrogenase (short-subunit alcohol dehydrogenase family)